MNIFDNKKKIIIKKLSEYKESKKIYIGSAQNGMHLRGYDYGKKINNKNINKMESPNMKELRKVGWSGAKFSIVAEYESAKGTYKRTQPKPQLPKLICSKSTQLFHCSSAANDSSLSFSMVSTVPWNLFNSSMVITCRHKGHSCLVSSHAVIQWVWK